MLNFDWGNVPHCLSMMTALEVELEFYKVETDMLDVKTLGCGLQ